MYGFRGAAVGWEKAYSHFLVDYGFVRGVVYPNVFFHPAHGIQIVVHGDDLFMVGDDDKLKLLRSSMDKMVSV